MVKVESGIALSSEYDGPALLDHILSTERETVRFRLLALVIAAATLYFGVAGRAYLLPIAAAALGYLIYTLLLGTVIIPWAVSRPGVAHKPAYLVYAMVVVDAAALNAIVFLIGGPKSAAIILLLLFIVYHSIYLGYVSALLSASLLSAFFIIFSYAWGEREFLISFVAFQVPVCYLIGLFGGYLAERRLRERCEREKLERLMFLHSVRRHPGDGAAKGVESILDEVVAAATRITGLSHSLLAVLEDHQLAGRAGKITLEELDLPSLDRLVFDRDDGQATDQALHAGQPVVISDGVRDAYKMPAWAQMLGAGSMLIMPISGGGRTWGVLYVFSLGKSRRISPLKIDLLKGYCGLAARALAGVASRPGSGTRPGSDY